MAIYPIDNLNVSIPNSKLSSAVNESESCNLSSNIPARDQTYLKIYLAVSGIDKSSDSLMSEEATADAIDVTLQGNFGNAEWFDAKNQVCKEEGSPLAVACDFLQPATIDAIKATRESTGSLDEAIAQVLEQNKSLRPEDQTYLKIYLAVSGIDNDSDFLMSEEATADAIDVNLQGNFGNAEWFDAKNQVCREEGSPLAVACDFLRPATIDAIKAARESTGSLDEAIASVLIIANKPEVCTVAVSGFEPGGPFAQGETIPKLTLSGKNLGRIRDIKSPKGSYKTTGTSISLTSEGKLEITNLKVPEGETIGNEVEITLLDLKGNPLTVSPPLKFEITAKVIGGGTGTPPPSGRALWVEKGAYALQKMMKARVVVEAGGGGFRNRKLEHAPRNNKAVLESEGVGKPTVNIGVQGELPILGKKDEAFSENETLELKVPFQFNSGYFLQKNEGSLLHEVGGGLNLKFNLSSSFSLEPYGKYSFKDADRKYPNQWFYSGQSHEALGGLAVSLDTEEWLPEFPFKARLLGEYQHTWFKWDKETLGKKFGWNQDQALKFGLEIILPFTQIKKDADWGEWSGAKPFIPDLRLSAAVTPWGQHSVPAWPSEILGLSQDYSLESILGWEIEAKAQWNNVKGYKPYLLGGYRSTTLKGDLAAWPAVSEAYWGLGVTIPDIGKVEVKSGNKWNVTPHYGESIPFYFQGSYCLPEELGDGRASGICLNVGYNQYKDPAGNGYNEYVGGLRFDLAKILFGKAPEENPFNKAQNTNPADAGGAPTGADLFGTP